MRFSLEPLEVKSLNNLGNVIGFTVMNKIRSKAFKVTTLVLLVLIVIGTNVPYVISLFDKNEATPIGMIQSADESSIAADLKAVFDVQENKELDIQLFDDQGSGEANEAYLKKQIQEGQIKGYLTQGELDEAGFPIMTYKSEENMDFGTQSKLENGLGQLKVQQVIADLGLTAEQVGMINSPVQVAKVQISVTGDALDEGKSAGEIAIASGLVYFLIIMLFIAVMVSGQLIATEITAEKSSRVMEILITSVAPLAQMFGKIIGIFLIGIMQIILFVGAAAISLMMPHNRSTFEGFNIDLSLIDPMLLVYALIFYVTGYLLYATLFAAVGSIVSRTEDLGQAITPVTMLSMVGYFIAIFGISAPNSMIVIVSSYIPFFSPFIMFLRMGVTEPALWEVWLSIGILLASIFGLGWLSAKIYRTGVLMYGKRPTFKELRKAMKAYKI